MSQTKFHITLALLLAAAGVLIVRSATSASSPAAAAKPSTPAATANAPASVPIPATTAAPFFDGTPTPADKAVMAQADKDIEKYRKGDFTLTLVDPNGKPVAGKAVVAELERHQFDFGTNSYGISAMKDDNPLKKIAQQTILDIFNLVISVNYWHKDQTAEEADLVGKDLAWAGANGLRTRFHAVLYNDPKPIFVGKNLTTQQCWQLMEDRIRYVTAATGAKPMQYDVINEMVSKLTWDKDKPDAFMKLVPQFPDLTDPQVVKRVYDMVRKYLPSAHLVGLEAQIPSIHNPVYMQIIDYWKRCLAAGADIDVIGTQCHFYARDGLPFQQGSKDWGPDVFTMSGISMALDTLRSIGKPIVITEFNGPSRNSHNKPDGWAKYWTMSEKENAAWQINFYKLAFSKPFIIGLTRWFQIDNVCGAGMDAGIIDGKGNKHQIYYDLKKLIKEEWHTRVVDKSSAAGKLAFRGFYGDYVVTVAGYKPAHITLDKGSGSLTVKLEK